MQFLPLNPNYKYVHMSVSTCGLYVVGLLSSSQLHCIKYICLKSGQFCLELRNFNAIRHSGYIGVCAHNIIIILSLQSS